MQRWKGKVAVVTGASAGIGAGICLRLADEGMRVVGLARRPALVDDLKPKVKGSGSIVSRRCDVSKPEDIASAFQWVEEALGGVDVLVNNAGVLYQGHITDVKDGEISDAHLAAVLDTNLRAVYLCTRRAVSAMKTRSCAGHVININSIAGHYIPMSETFNIYASTKHAVTAFSASLLGELATLETPIRVTSISPGLVDTRMAAAARGLRLPMLSVADVADAVAYALGVPPTVNINEITITSVLEKSL